jgi:hypothetical protein
MRGLSASDIALLQPSRRGRLQRPSAAASSGCSEQQQRRQRQLLAIKMALRAVYSHEEVVELEG